MNQQRGGTLVGFIVGVIVGLGAALAVAVYVTKVPVPFMNKGQSRSAEQDEAEALKNKNWDPNAPLYGKNPAKPNTAVAPEMPTSAPGAKVVPPVKSTEKAEGKTEAKADPKADTKADSKPESKPAVAADPLADLAKAKLAASEPFYYFVQVGAYRNSEDAEAQRAKLSLSGIVTKISEREQSGQIVYRVRVGPFDKKDEAEKSKEKLDASGLETALVRVQRQ